MKSYTDGAISSANTQLKAYTDGLISYVNTINNTQNTNITISTNLAQGAYDKANTDYTTVVATAGTYGGTTAIPVVTVTANGRISAISNTSITAGATITDDITSNATRYVMLGQSTSGSYIVANTSSTKLTYNPSTGTLNANALSIGSTTVINSNKQLVNTTELTSAISVTSGAFAIPLDLTTASTFVVTLSASATFTFTNPSATTNTLQSFTVIVINNATGGYTPTWPATVKWAGAILPPATTTANAVDVWTFFTYNNGTSYVGSLAMKAVA